MGILDDFRQKYPQYKDVPDANLAEGLYNKYYAGKMTREEFDAKLENTKTEPVRPPSLLPDRLQNFGAGLYKGLAESISGPVQFTLDSLFPETGQKFTEFVNKTLEPTDKLYGKNPEFLAGEVGGGAVLPLAAGGVAGLATKGAIASAVRGLTTGFAFGSSQYSEATDPGQREFERAIAGTAGAAIGAVADPLAGAISKGVSKLANSKVLSELTSQFQRAYEAIDPNLAGVQKAVSTSLNKVDTKWRGIQQAVQDTGAKVRVPDKIKDTLSEEFADASARLKDSVTKNAKAQQILGSIAEKVGAAKVQLPKEYARLSLDAKAQITEQLRRQNSFKTTSYSELRNMFDDLDGFVRSNEGKELSDTDIGVLKNIRDSFKRALTQVEKQSPELKRAVSKSDKFKRENVDIFERPEVKRLIAAKTDEQRASAIADAATSGDEEISKAFAKMLGKTGRQRVNEILVKRGVDEAFDAKNGTLDPAKFAAFFDKLGPAGDQYIDQVTRQQIRGIKNLLSERALILGQAPSAPHIPEHYTPAALAALGIYHLVTGDVGGGLKLVAGGGVTAGVTKYLNQMMKDRMGKSLLAAASRARPGSPRMARISQAIADRFGPVVETEAGQEMMTR